MPLVLVTWTHILSTLAVIIPLLLWFCLKSSFMIVDFFLKYRYLLSLLLLLCIPKESFLTLMDTPFLQYMSLPSLYLLVVDSTLNPLQCVRLTWMPSCDNYLMITELNF